MMNKGVIYSALLSPIARRRRENFGLLKSILWISSAKMSAAGGKFLSPDPLFWIKSDWKGWLPPSVGGSIGGSIWVLGGSRGGAQAEISRGQILMATPL